MNWIPLTDLGQLNEIINQSTQKAVVIFKHSTRCSVSRMALRQFEKEYDISDEKATPYFLDLLNFRDISNEIANRFSVVHRSPQVILIENGKATYSDTHSDIDAEVLKNKIN